MSGSTVRRAGLVVLAALVPACQPRPAVVTPVTLLVSAGRFASADSAAAAEGRVDWWDAGGADDAACTQSFAALELGRFLPRCLGLREEDVRVSEATRLPESGDVIVLGSRGTHPLAASLLRTPRRGRAEGSGGFRIEALRRGPRSIVVIEGDDPAGTLYGAYAFLEQLGMRFYGLGETGTVYPSAPVRLPRKIRLEESPGFATRGFWAFDARGNLDFFLWMARNRMSLWTAADTGYVPLMKKLGLRLTGGGHSIQSDFLGPDREYPYDHPRWRGDEGKPTDPYAPGPAPPEDADHDGRLSTFEAHPEWYGLHSGRRSDAIHGESGDNYCTSNGDATRELAANLVRSLSHGRLRHADVVNLWMLDGGRWCECDACRAQGTPTDRLLAVARQVGEAIAAARRGGRLARAVQLTVPAYVETSTPPTRPLPAGSDSAGTSVTYFPYFRCYAHALGDPSCTEINRGMGAKFEGWASKPGRYYRGALTIGEYYNVSWMKSLPVAFPHVMEADIAWYYRNGARHFHTMHAPTRLWGTWTLSHALLARLLWRPEARADSLLADFCRLYYPTTSEHMRAFYDDLEAATSNLLTLKHCVGALGTWNLPGGRLADAREPLFPLRHFQVAATHPATDDARDLPEMVEAMRLARLDLDHALAACADTLERVRLAEDEHRFRYGEATFALYEHLIGTALRHRSKDAAGARREFALAAAAAEQLRQVRDLVQVAAAHANSRDGLEASGVAETVDYFRKLYGNGASGNAQR